jgi:hypothetical protein
MPRPWTPADDPAITAWFDASDDDSFVLVDGRVAEWRSRIGGSVLANGVVSGQPVRDGDWLNTVDRMLRLADGSWPDPCAIMACLWNVNFARTFGVALGVGPGNGQILTRQSLSGNTAVTFYQWNANGSDWFEDAITRGDPAPGFVSGNTSSNGFWRGLPAATAPMLWSARFNGITAFRLGTTNAGEGSASWWNDLIVCPAADQTTELRQKVEGYLAHKAGISLTLPADHPYKNAPPMT